MRVALLVIALALAASGQIDAQCKARVDAFALDDDFYVATQARKVCASDDWLLWFFQYARDTYNLWVRTEQKFLGFQEIISHAKMRACFKEFTVADTSFNSFDFIEQLTLYKSIASKDVRAQKACELWSKFLDPKAPLQVNLADNARIKAVLALLRQCTAPGTYRDEFKLDKFDAVEEKISMVLSGKC
jgi:hypothetical protein